QLQRQTLHEQQQSLEPLVETARQAAHLWQQRWQEQGGQADLVPEAPGSDALGALRQAESQLLAAARLAAQLQGQAQNLGKRRLQQQAQLHESTQAWQLALAHSPFPDEAGFLAACLDEDQRSALQTLKEQLHHALAAAQALQHSA